MVVSLQSPQIFSLIILQRKIYRSAYERYKPHARYPLIIELLVKYFILSMLHRPSDRIMVGPLTRS